MASILVMNSPVLADNFQISFEVANEMNKSELIKEIEELLPYLRNHLNNQILSISIGISENIKEETIFSSTEKYQHLLKINPVLDTLRKTFNLDF
jgi:DNA polymerase-3 subunit gamma/tau